MFRSKRDVDRHVSDILSKINNENERNLRGYNFARLYFQVKDYETAKRYLAGFLSVRDHHAPSHKLMAQIFENTGNIERALQSYKRSLEIDPNQKDIVLKICELYCQLPVDHETARYWADRADQLFSHNEIVFRLRECLVTAEGEPNRTELENLIATELLARPNDLNLRIKLLRLYLDTERIKEAYAHALKIESKKLYPISTDWYYCLIDIFEAYQEEVDQELDSDFYIHFLTALDNLISLTLAESHALGYGCEKASKHSCSINDAASSLHMFDQQLGKASKITLRDGSWSYFLHHMKGQLYFRMATIIMKRAKKDQGNWKEACRVGAALFLIGYTFKPSNLLQEVWFTKMDEKQKIFTNFFQQGALRTSYTGHVIMSLCKEDKSKWLQKIKQDVCLPQVRERTYQRLFSNISQKQSASTSYFLQDATFVESSLEFPSLIALQEYDKAAFKLRPDSLHHLVWLLLHQMNHEVESDHQSLYKIFEGLQYSNNNLSKGSPESLCQLDIEAFLQATVYTINMYLEHRCITVNPRSGDTPLSVPPDIAEPLCTKDQGLWWSATYGLVTSSVKEKLGEQRRILQRGLEVIRGIGNHGLDVKLVVHLAHIFANSAQSTTSTSIVKDDNENGKVQSEEVKCLEFRAAHYWNVALGMLEKLGCNQTIKVPKERMFDNYNKDLSSEEILALKEEGQLYLACRAMNSGKLEEAAAIFNKLSSPFASFYLALTLKESANQQMENKPIRDVSPKTWNTHVALLNKAKEALYLTMDRIKGDKNHPLNQTLFAEIERIEHEILENSNSSNIDYSGGSDEVDEYDDVDNKSLSPQNSKSGTPSHVLYRLSHHSTPRPAASFMSPRTKNRNLNDRQYKHLQPSPERLDAQIRALSLTQDTLIKTLLEQQRTLLDTNKTIVEELKQNKEVVEQLKKQLEEFHIATVKSFNRRNTYKKSEGKGQGDYEEEDYHDYDANGCLIDYYVDDNSQEIDYRRSYHYTHPHMVTEASGTSTINYVPQPPPPQGPPPPLNHYGYQYPPPPALAPVTPTQISERQQYFHSTLGPGLPFSEGQQLPQFHFHVASPVSKPSVLGRLGPVPQQITPSTVASSVPQQSPQTSVMQPHVPWAKGGTVPHAFQIPLPPTATVMSPPSQPPSVLSTPSPFVPPHHVSQQTLPTAFPTAGSSTTTTESQLKTLLSTPSPSVNIPVFRQSPGSTSITPASKNTPSSTNVSPFGSSTLNRSLGTPSTGRTRQDSDIAESGGSEAESHDVEREVMGDFKPVIPLPAEVVTATGEEEEKVIFEERAKLFRFVDREWKERGIGTVKLLLHEHAGKVRLLMRRDQVLKVCANHYILPSMEIHPMTGTDRAWIWAAQDFADEEVKPEQFCIKFKTSDIAITFKKAFDNAIALAKEAEQKSKGNELQHEQQQAVANSDLPSATTQKTTPVFGSKILPKFGSKFIPKPGSWPCSVCYVNNDADKTTCIACESRKPGSHLEQQQAVTDNNLPPTASQKTVSSFGFKFLPKPGSWSCPVCYVNNDADKTVCPACESLKPGSHFEQQPTVRDGNLPPTTLQKTVSSFGSKFLPKPGSWSCSVCYVNNDADKTVCIACESPKPGSQPQPSTRSPFAVNSNSTGFEICSFGGRSLTSQSPVNKINETRSTTDSESKTNDKPTEPSRPASVFLSLLADQHNIQEAQNKCKSSEQPKTMFGGFTFTSAPVVKESESPEAKDREILVVTTKAKNGPQVNKIEASKPSPFSGFSFKMSVSPIVSTSALSTSASSATNVSSPDSVIIVHTEKKEQIKSDSEQPVFGTKSDVTNLQFTSLKNSSAGFQKDPSFKGFAGAGAPVFTTAKEDKRISENTGDGAPEEFEPTVEFKPVVPLPALIDVKTGEEDDEKLFGERAKLFRYDSEGKQWKERGIGELKILYQKSTEKYRILMRREQVHKLCANHNILPEMKLTPLSTSDRSWAWMAHDYSDGELKEEKFAVKFKTSDLAQQFLKVFEKCQAAQKQSVQSEQRKPTERITDPCINNKKTLSEIFKPELGSWECNVCLVRNEASKMVCCACETPKPGTETATSVKHTQPTVSNSLSNFQFGIPSQISASKGTEASTISTTHISSKPFTFDNSVPQTTTTQLPGIIFGQTQPTAPTTFVFGQPPYANAAKTSLGFKPSQSANNLSDSKVMFGSENIFSGAAISTTNSSANSSSSLTVTPVTVPPAYVFGSLSSTNTNFGATDQEQNQSSDIVQFRFGSPQKYEFNFSGVRPRSPTKTPKSPKSPGTPSDADGEEEEVEPSDVDSIYFQPVIPLPPKVDVKTGEEDEEVLFSKRAKLFRFVSGEWKERGVGDIKILHNPSQKTIRLLMRRDQVLKVCLNHYLGADIKFTSKGDKSFQWAATDFSENEPNPEQLAIRFKTAETALQFKEAVDCAMKKLGFSADESTDKKESEVCVSDQQPSLAPTPKSPPSFSFRLDGQKTNPPTNAGFSLALRFGATSLPTKSLFGNISLKCTPTSDTDANIASTDSFATKANKDMDNDIEVIESKTVSLEKKQLAAKLKLPPNFYLYESKPPCPGCRGCEKEDLEKTSRDDLTVVYEVTPTKKQIEAAAKLMLPPTFYLYEDKPPCPGCRGCHDEIPSYIGCKDELKEESPSVASSDVNIPDIKCFMTNTLSTFSFADLASKGSGFEVPAASTSRTKTVFAGAGTPVFGCMTQKQSEEEGDDDHVVPAPDIHFEPVVPLPEIVDVKTGEEDEAPIFCQRAKLYRYDGSTRQWKERGVGDFKILQHKEKCRFRLILRREQVHKVACNHYLTQNMELTPLPTSENALCWNAIDFAEGQTSTENFAVRFKNKDILEQFRKKVEECKKILSSQTSSEDSSPEQSSLPVVQMPTNSSPKPIPAVSEEFTIPKIATQVCDLVGKDTSNAVSTINHDQTLPSVDLPIAQDNNKDKQLSEQETAAEKQEEEYEDEEDDDDMMMFEKRITLEIFDEKTRNYKSEGLGTLRVLYDDSVFGYHIQIVNDEEAIVCDHIIAIQTCLRVEKRCATWAAIDISIDPPKRRQFRAIFSSVDAAQEFNRIFEEGKQAAVQAEIVEKEDIAPTSPIRDGKTPDVSVASK